MPKLTKTQQALIERARRFGGSAQVEAGGGRGPQGGRINFGNREMAALQALLRAGVAREVSRHSGNVSMGNGASVWTCCISYKLTA